MLQSISDSIKGWVGYTLVVFVTFAFIWMGIAYYLQQNTGANAVVAKVGKSELKLRQFNSFFRLVSQQIEQQQQQSLSPGQRSSLKREAFEKMVSELQQNEALKAIGLVIPRSYIEQRIMSDPSFQSNGAYSPYLLQRFLNSRGTNYSSYISQLGSRIASNQLAQGIANTSVSLPDRLKKYYDWSQQRRTYRYITIKPRLFLSGIKTTDKMIQDYYASHKSDFRSPAQINVAYVRLDPAALAKKFKVTTQQAKQYYSANSQAFRYPARYRFAQITLPKSKGAQGQGKETGQYKAINTALAAGQRIAQIASQYGGQVQELSAGDLNPQLLAHLQEMKPTQQLSNQDLGDKTIWLELLSVTPGKLKSFSSVSKSIRSLLLSREVAKHMAPMAQTLSEVSYTQSDSLQPVAKALGLPVQTTGPQGLSKPLPGLLGDQKIMRAIQSDDVLQSKNNSLPIKLKDGSLVVVRVKSYHPSKVQPLSAVKKQVLRRLRKNQSSWAAAAFAEKVLKATRSHSKGSLKSLMKRHSLRWTNVSSVSREMKKQSPQSLRSPIPPVVRQAVFDASMKKPANRVVLDNDSIVVFELLAIKLPQQTALKPSMKQTIRLKIQRQFALLDYKSFWSAVREQVTVKRFMKKLQSV